MLNILSLIGDRLNQGNILWAVGASVLLNQYGLQDKPGDIDILVDVLSIESADKILSAIGQKRPGMVSELYASKHFYQYEIDGVDVDVMAGLAIRHDMGVFEYVFDAQSVAEIKNIKGSGIPFCSLEDWYVIYQIIPGRQAKAAKIKEYLLAKGLSHPNLLHRMLAGNVPKEVKHNISNLLENSLQENLPKDEKVQKFLTDLMIMEEEKFLILQELRKIVRLHLPDVGERMMYGGIMFTCENDWGGVFTYREHVSFEFSEGTQMNDPQKHLQGKGKTRRHLKIKLFSDIKDRDVDFFVRQAAAFMKR